METMQRNGSFIRISLKFTFFAAICKSLKKIINMLLKKCFMRLKYAKNPKNILLKLIKYEIIIG